MRLNYVRKIMSDSFISVPLIGALAVLLTASIAVYASLRNTDHLLVIHFVGGGGIDFLGDLGDMVSIIASAIVASLVNSALIFFFYPRIQILSRLIAFFTLFFAVLILIAVGVIISVN